MAVTFTALQLPTILTKATCLYEPSVYNGTGLETRKNLVLIVSDVIRAQIAKIEAELDLGPSICSIIKTDGIRVKVDMERVSFYDADHMQIKQPEQFAHAEVEVRCEMRGTWKTTSSYGLSIRCTDIRFLSEGKTSPFK